MKFLADESVDKQIVDCLRDEGYSVLYVAEIEPGISDDKVIQQANQESAILITADKDFGELVFRHGRIVCGVVLIRLAGLSLQHKAKMVEMTVKEHSAEIGQNFTVVSPGAVRIRKHTD